VYSNFVLLPLMRFGLCPLCLWEGEQLLRILWVTRKQWTQFYGERKKFVLHVSWTVVAIILSANISVVYLYECIQWVPEALSLGIKWLGHEANCSPQRMSGARPPFPNMPTCRGAQLKHRDNFTFYFYLYFYECNDAREVKWKKWYECRS
jgi:hypothetical protein